MDLTDVTTPERTLWVLRLRWARLPSFAGLLVEKTFSPCIYLVSTTGGEQHHEVQARILAEPSVESFCPYTPYQVVGDRR